MRNETQQIDVGWVEKRNPTIDVGWVEKRNPTIDVGWVEERNPTIDVGWIEERNPTIDVGWIEEVRSSDLIRRINQTIVRFCWVSLRSTQPTFVLPLSKLDNWFQTKVLITDN